MTTDFTRGVEAAASMAEHWAAEHDGCDAPLVLRDLADRMRKVLVDSAPPAPDLVGVSEADVERYVDLYRSIVCAELDRLSDVAPVSAPIRCRDAGIRAVVAAVRAEATPPVDLSALGEAVRTYRRSADLDDMGRVVEAALALVEDTTPVEAVGAAVMPRCPTCGDEVAVRSAGGMKWCLSRGRYVDVPAHVMVPRCAGCGDDWLRPEDVEAIEAACRAEMKDPDQ
jgi:hypothetical protein